MQSNVGPGALLRLIGGALRLDAETFKRAVAELGETRLHLAILLLAALSSGFSYAMEAVGAGLVAEHDFALYRLLVFVGVAEAVVHFVLFVALIYVLRRVTRRSPVRFLALMRLMALALAPLCLLIVGPLVGIPEWWRGVLTMWRIAASVFALRVGTDSSWLGALALVLAADLVASPIVNVILFGAAQQHGPMLPA